MTDTFTWTTDFPGGKEVKSTPANTGVTGDAGLIPGLEDPLKEEMATHSSILAWKFTRTEEHGGLQSTGSERIRHD